LSNQNVFPQYWAYIFNVADPKAIFVGWDGNNRGCSLTNSIGNRLCKPVQWPEDWSSRETLNKSICVSRFCQKPWQFHADTLWNVSVVYQISLLLWKTKITGNFMTGFLFGLTVSHELIKSSTKYNIATSPKTQKWL